MEMAYEELEHYQKREEKKRSRDHEDSVDPSHHQKVNGKTGKLNQQKEGPCSRCGGNHPIDQCSRDRGVCFRCKKLGHKLKDCLVAKGACFHCKRPGHIAVNCPEKTVQN